VEGVEAHVGGGGHRDRDPVAVHVQLLCDLCNNGRCFRKKLGSSSKKASSLWQEGRIMSKGGRFRPQIRKKRPLILMPENPNLTAMRPKN
jgi:hypothetical protein